MRHCPSCGETYDDDVRFCESDGIPLVSSPEPETVEGLSGMRDEYRSQSGREKTSPLLLIVIGIAAAAFVAVVALYFAMTPAAENTEALQASNSSEIARPVATRPILAESIPSPEETPSPTPTPSPSPTPTPVSAATPQIQRDVLEGLSDSPATTSGSGARAARRVIIQLVEGRSIEADDAWRASGGLWYRTSGIVSFLERSRIRSIERVATPTPSPATP